MARLLRHSLRELFWLALVLAVFCVWRADRAAMEKYFVDQDEYVNRLDHKLKAETDRSRALERLIINQGSAIDMMTGPGKLPDHLEMEPKRPWSVSDPLRALFAGEWTQFAR